MPQESFRTNATESQELRVLHHGQRYSHGVQKILRGTNAGFSALTLASTKQLVVDYTSYPNKDVYLTKEIFVLKSAAFSSECFLLSHTVECCLGMHSCLYTQPVLFHLIKTEKASTILLGDFSFLFPSYLGIQLASIIITTPAPPKGKTDFPAKFSSGSF